MADLTITAANVLRTAANYEVGIAGATITAGQVVYKDSTDANKLKLAQADGTAAEVAAAGVALHGATANQPLAYATGGTMNVGATTAKTTTYCVSATAGGIAPQADLTSGQRICQVGYATATDGSFVVAIVNRGVAV
jgi:hypothetical protein